MEKTSGLGHVKSSSARWAALVSWRGRGAAQEGQLESRLPTSRVPPECRRWQAEPMAATAAGWQHTISSSGGVLSGPRSDPEPAAAPHSTSVQHPKLPK